MNYTIISDPKNKNSNKKSKYKKSNKPYLKYSISAPKSVRSQLFDFLTEEYKVNESSFPSESWVLLFHILNCSSYKQYLWHFEGRTAYLIPIPRDLRDSLKGGERGGHGEFLVPLEEAGLIHVYPYQKKERCYYYEADFPLRMEYMRLMIENSFQTLKDGIENDLVDLASGNEVSKKNFEKSANTYYDENRNEIKNQQTDAIKYMPQKVPVNIQLAYELLKPDYERALAEGNEDLLNKTESDLMKIRILQEQGERYEYQLLVDPFTGMLKYYKILVYNQSFDPPHYLGRIYDYKCGYVGLSGATKSALRYCFYKGKMQWNYDLSACYPSILKSLAEKYNIVDPLFEGQDIKERRKEISKELNVIENLIKFCFNSTIFNAHFPSKKEAEKELEKHEKDMISIPQKVWAYCQDEDEYHRILDSLRPLLKKYNKFIKKVIKAWCDDPDNQSGNKKSYINGVNRSFPLKKKYTRDEKNKLQTFVLQGYEAAFIMKLITLGEKYGFEPTHSEHDGICAVGDIPSEAIQECREKSGFKYAILEAKDNTYQHNQHKG